MATLRHATFEDTETHQVSVSVSLTSSPNSPPRWVAKARSNRKPDVIVFRQFATVDDALRFAFAVLDRGLERVTRGGDQP